MGIRRGASAKDNGKEHEGGEAGDAQHVDGQPGRWKPPYLDQLCEAGYIDGDAACGGRIRDAECGGEADRSEEHILRGFNVYPLFLVAYAVLFVFIGFVAGYYFNKFVYNERVRRIIEWARREIQRLHRRPLVVDDWDPINHWDPINQELRQYRIHERPQDADSGEEYFRETENGLARYVRPHYQARIRLGVEELDPLEAMQLRSPKPRRSTLRCRLRSL